MDTGILPSPLPAVEIDRRFLPESALAWFHNGTPTEPEVKS
jgi:hypothetical protein